jgi:hypothetical protein
MAVSAAYSARLRDGNLFASSQSSTAGMSELSAVPQLPDADADTDAANPRTDFVAVAWVRHHRVSCGCAPSLCENARN